MITFTDLGLRPEILQAITEMGYNEPTPVQERAIPLLLGSQSDLLARASTGTGKTAAYGLPLLQVLDFDDRWVQALVLAPTRELCVQITKEIEHFAKYMSNVSVVPVYGGASIGDQIRKIKKGSQIVVATPGRLIDLIGRGAIDLEKISVLVLDEADEMLNIGFKEAIDEILASTSPEKMTWLFSATMSSEVRRIAGRYMNDPNEVTIGKTKEGAENIRHVYYLIPSKHRYSALKRIVDFSPELFGIVFCRTKIETQEIAEKLTRDGYNADALHGDLNQTQRDKVMGRFRDHQLRVLVATDVAARGIDVSDITHVVHYNLPEDLENYTHRSGRTARAGKHGVSISLVTPKENGRVRQLEKALNRKFLRELVPTGKDICELKLFGLLQKAIDVEVKEEEMEVFMPRMVDVFKDMEKEEVIRRFASIEFNQFLEYYRKAPDLNADAAPSHDGNDRYVTGNEMFINLGKMDGFDRSELLKYICDETGVERSLIGRIEVKGVYSFFETEPSAVPIILKHFEAGQKFQGRRIRVDTSGKDKQQGKSYGGGGGERKSYGSGGGGERKSYGSGGGGERKSYGSGGGGERKSYGSGGGSERKSYGGSGGTGEKKIYGSGDGNSSSTSPDKKKKRHRKGNS